MAYSVQQLAEVLHASWVGPGPDQWVEQLLLDSRKWHGSQGDLFIALRGPRHDGHRFVSELYKKGQRLFLVDDQFSTDGFPEATFLIVPNTLEALQRLAAYHRSQFSYPVVGITGSNGKTIVKEWLFQLLQYDYEIVRSPRSYNSQVGVPLSVWQMNSQDELALFEAGISQTGEMKRLQRILLPTYGIFTNIGDAHDEGFKSRSDKVREKVKLFSNCEWVVCPADNEMIANELKQLGVETVSWSFSNEADLRVLALQQLSNDRTKIMVQLEAETYQATVPFVDRASLENVITCWAFLWRLGVPVDSLPARLSQLEPISMRLELLEGTNHCRIINDAYNSDLTSLRIALDFMNQQGYEGKKTVILSDIQQSGRGDKKLYQEVSQQLVEHEVDRLITVGKHIETIEPFLPSKMTYSNYPDTSSLLEALSPTFFWNELILIKGARDFHFERVSQRLARKQHQAILEVNLSAIRHNLNWFQSRLSSSTQIMVMVKAGAYGSGSEEIARMLEYLQVAYLAVAYTDEGVQLREAGIALPIMVLNPDPAEWPTLFEHRLEPEIFHMEMLKDFHAYARSASVTPSIHLKLDTGMHRLGFGQYQLQELEAYLRSHKDLKIASVFSHLAAADVPEEDDYTLNQVRLFEENAASIAKAIGYQPLCHILNTPGILRFPQYQFDMVRLGIGLFGLDPLGDKASGLEVALSLKASITQVRSLEKGETVGYGRKGVIEQPTLLAVVRIGYADGLLRKAGNGAFSLFIRGQNAPIVGNVCMDMCMIDVTHIPDVKMGDEVIVFGKQKPIEQLADALETIPYEVLTNVSPRVKRLYLQE